MDRKMELKFLKKVIENWEQIFSVKVFKNSTKNSHNLNLMKDYKIVMIRIKRSKKRKNKMLKAFAK